MTVVELQQYINALRRCAQEHDNDTTYTGHIIISDLCRDTANLLEALKKECQAESDKFAATFQDGYDNGYAQTKFDYKQDPTTKVRKARKKNSTC